MRKFPKSDRAPSWFVRAVFTAIVLGVCATASALNGNVWVESCTTCSTISQFQTSGLQKAQARAFPGTYVVIGESNYKTGLVKVTGMRSVTCPGGDRNNCTATLLNPVATVITPSGATATADADLGLTDDYVFVKSRRSLLPPVLIDGNFASSIVGSIDQEVSPGITQELTSNGTNVGGLPIGTVVTVVFPDGTKGQFIKQCNCSDMWQWNGNAWNASGQRIGRNGAPILNPNSSGGGGGSRNFTGLGGISFRVQYLGGTDYCHTTVSVGLNGVEYIFKRVEPC